jgi:hypothetical protein
MEQDDKLLFGSSPSIAAPDSEPGTPSLSELSGDDLADIESLGTVGIENEVRVLKLQQDDHDTVQDSPFLAGHPKPTSEGRGNVVSGQDGVNLQTCVKSTTTKRERRKAKENRKKTENPTDSGAKV